MPKFSCKRTADISARWHTSNYYCVSSVIATFTMRFSHITLVSLATFLVGACSSPPSTLSPVQVSESVVLTDNYFCSNNSKPYEGNETHRCFFHPVQIPQRDFSSPELRAKFVRELFFGACKSVVITSDTPFSGAPQQGVVLRRVGLRCEQ